MKSLYRNALVVVALTVSAACGGGDGGDGGGPDDPTNFSLRVDGDRRTGLGVAARSAGGIYTITGADGTDGFSIQLYNIPSAGTYALGINATGFGGTGLISTPGAGWATPLNGLSGSITITTLTDTRIAGTFHYSADALNGTATGTVEVTDGEFDMLMSTAGAWTPPDAWDGSQLNGRIGADTIVGATMGVIFNGNNLLFNAGDLTHVFAITVNDLTTTGVKAFHDSPPARRIQLSNLAGTEVYLTDSTSAGNITVTTLNANRIAGSYTAMLKRLGAAGTVNVSGTFDVGIPHF